MPPADTKREPRARLDAQRVAARAALAPVHRATELPFEYSITVVVLGRTHPAS